eukprot:7377900-Prymnesium_polylepis.1
MPRTAPQPHAPRPRRACRVTVCVTVCHLLVGTTVRLGTAGGVSVVTVAIHFTLNFFTSCGHGVTCRSPGWVRSEEK